MYKVKVEDPDIIARFREEPLLDDIFSFQGDEGKFSKKWDRLEKFITNAHVNPSKKLERIYEFVDWFLADSGIAKNAVCQKGCAHCCFVDVDVTAFEALYIAKKAGLTPVSRRSRVRSGYHIGKQYCPFLDKEDASCSIHAFRPLACRTFFSFDNPKFCAENEGGAEHAIFTSGGHAVLRHLRDQLYLASDQRSADIREWFAEFADDAPTAFLRASGFG